jgi:hypothetical protein
MTMIEVFKTNVTTRESAHMLIDQIHMTFTGYEANFDLDDCDHILRIHYEKGNVESSLIICLLKNFKFDAEILAEDCETFFSDALKYR